MSPARINRTKFPDRYALVLRELERREMLGDDAATSRQKQTRRASKTKPIRLDVTCVIGGAIGFLVFFPDAVCGFLKPQSRHSGRNIRVDGGDFCWRSARRNRQENLYLRGLKPTDNRNRTTEIGQQKPAPFNLEFPRPLASPDCHICDDNRSGNGSAAISISGERRRALAASNSLASSKLKL